MPDTPTEPGERRKPRSLAEASIGAHSRPLKAISDAAATTIAEACERLLASPQSHQHGFAETGMIFSAEDAHDRRFEDSVRLQRLFASMDDEHRRQALLYIAEALAQPAKTD